MSDDVDTREAAERLGVTRQRVLQFIQEKRLKARWFGRQWAITRADLEAFAAIPRPAGKPPGKGEEDE